MTAPTTPYGCRIRTSPAVWTPIPTRPRRTRRGLPAALADTDTDTDTDTLVLRSDFPPPTAGRVTSDEDNYRLVPALPAPSGALPRPGKARASGNPRLPRRSIRNVDAGVAFGVESNPAETAG
ncbi:hypothetical protein [Streptomyces sp. NBC_00102]|uniref:hypothetical protein n=1 Tax=Streptomyces sp. NBC_00102 TaxID=2975652 RepID=UPI00224FCA27|nr:hypothetical protein [Streptomyces sp. NBC_00102]MCX5401978.1 hypothetical protein [Streptomyces sp. NBC_00102]